VGLIDLGHEIFRLAQKLELKPNRPLDNVTSMMTTTLETSVNQHHVSQAERAWSELLREALQRGFHGVAGLELSVQDGTIQHVRRRIERLLK
jgi:hypothetical protein